MPSDPAAVPPLPTCRCGHTRAHRYAVAETRYGCVGFLVGLFMGVSGIRPREVTFRCIRCDETFDASRDPALLKRLHNH